MIASQFSMYFVYKILNILIVLLRHVKASPHIKIYQSLHYSAFIQSEYRPVLLSHMAEIWDSCHLCEQLENTWKIVRRNLNTVFCIFGLTNLLNNESFCIFGLTNFRNNAPNVRIKGQIHAVQV